MARRPPSEREVRLRQQVIEADALVTQILTIQPDSFENDGPLAPARAALVAALDHLASEQVARKAFAEARTTIERALQWAPGDEALRRHYSEVVMGLGNEQVMQGELRAAIDSFDEAISIDAGNAAAFNNLGNLMADQLNMTEAESALRQAIAIHPHYAEAHFNLSRVLLMQGKYAEGWQENEWRWDCPAFPSTWRDFPYPYWDGEDLAGKNVLVWSEQGIGDEIMFANALPDVIAEAAHVTIECNARLVPLYRRSFPTASVVARETPPDAAIDRADIDVQLPLASLCVRYRASKEAFGSNPGHYLVADPARTRSLRARYDDLADGLLIGICWRSGNPVVGHERSAALDYWDAILKRPGCRFISLQYGDVGSEIAAVQDRLGVTIHRDTEIDPFTSIEDWFAQVAAMDHVISIDNSTIQVSGSLGIPTWTMLNYSPEWRFGTGGSGHDWHPSIRVFRQPAPGDWEHVFEAVDAALEDRLRLASSN